ncbi:MAG: hypothetical protein GTO18_06040 [Anaerolineales bacterium]|nr:hypothetical protein [Anaerolineales bacterium]
MKTMSVLDRILLLATCLLAAYQIAVGIDEMDTLAVISYTVAFGVLLVACLLLIIYGFEVLESPIVVIVATFIPLSISLGLISQHTPGYETTYLTLSTLGLFGILISRYLAPGNAATIILAFVHGVAGIIIVLLPISLVFRGTFNSGFILVSLGGIIAGVGGLLLYSLRIGRPIIAAERIYSLVPSMLLLMTVSFVAGMGLA